MLKVDEKVDDTLANGWESFYLRHFEIGLRFPIMGLVEELCTCCQIHRLEFSAIDFFYSYFIKLEKPDMVCFVLNTRPHGWILVLGFSSNERRGKDKYFFAKGVTRLCKDPSYPLCWKDSCSLLFQFLFLLL